MLRLARRVVLMPLVALLCVAAAVLWRRSYGDVDMLVGVGPATTFNVAASCEGELVLFFSQIPSDPGRQWSLQPLRAPVEEVRPLYGALFEPGSTLRASLIGFQLGHGTIDVFKTPPAFTALTVPHWFVVLVTAVPTLLWLRGAVRRWRWERSGRCTSCGYDLRTTPDRCPECGAQPARRRRAAPAPAAVAAAAAAAFLAAVAPCAAPAAENASRRLDEVDLSRGTLEGAFDVLRELTHANIVVRWPALEAAGVDRTTPVKLRLWDVRLGVAINVLLVTVESPTPLGWSEEDGVITVSTSEDIHRDTVTRVYDVRDLIVALNEMQFPGFPNDDDTGRTWQQCVDEITRFVTETVVPDTWRDAGGSIGSIRELGGRLIVTQSPENHTQLRDLLKRLREEFARPMPVIQPVPATAPADGRPLAGNTRVYDVRDLLAASAAIDAEWNSDPRTPDDLEDQLVDAIIDNVEPYSWQGRPNRNAVGSTGFGINVIGGRLMVRQSPEGHEMLKRFLAELRKELLPGVKLPATSPSAPIRRARPRVEGLFGSARD
jgi:hypothetical protein